MTLSELNVHAVEFVPTSDPDVELERIAKECARNVYEFDMTEHDTVLLQKSKWRRTMNGALNELKQVMTTHNPKNNKTHNNTTKPHNNTTKPHNNTTNHTITPQP
jgi:hypothetical protein